MRKGKLAGGVAVLWGSPREEVGGEVKWQPEDGEGSQETLGCSDPTPAPQASAAGVPRGA